MLIAEQIVKDRAEVREVHRSRNGAAAHPERCRHRVGVDRVRQALPLVFRLLPFAVDMVGQLFHCRRHTLVLRSFLRGLEPRTLPLWPLPRHQAVAR